MLPWPCHSVNCNTPRAESSSKSGNQSGALLDPRLSSLGTPFTKYSLNCWLLPSPPLPARAPEWQPLNCCCKATGSCRSSVSSSPAPSQQTSENKKDPLSVKPSSFASSNCLCPVCAPSHWPPLACTGQKLFPSPQGLCTHYSFCQEYSSLHSLAGPFHPANACGNATSSKKSSLPIPPSLSHDLVYVL